MHFNAWLEQQNPWVYGIAVVMAAMVVPVISLLDRWHHRARPAPLPAPPPKYTRRVASTPPIGSYARVFGELDMSIRELQEVAIGLRQHRPMSPGAAFTWSTTTTVSQDNVVPFKRSTSGIYPIPTTDTEEPKRRTWHERLRDEDEDLCRTPSDHPETTRP